MRRVGTSMGDGVSNVAVGRRRVLTAAEKPNKAKHIKRKTMDLESELTVWYLEYAFKNGWFGRKPLAKWSWPTVADVCRVKGMDEDELRDSLESGIVIRNGKVGFARNPTIGGLHNPNSGF